MSNTKFLRQAWFALGLTIACLMSAVPAASAQTPGNGAWQPWLGCWSAAPPRFVDLEAEPQQVCVLPVANTAAVDVVTITGSKIVSRERIDPNGEHRPGEREGCTGWDSARWSADMRRVYLQSEYTCTGGVKRATTGLMASAANGDWLDIVGVGLKDKVGVRVLRHRPSPPLPTLPTEVASAVARDSREPAPLKTLLPIGDAEIVDASKYVSGAVIEAWLAENRQKFTMNGKRLAALANAGVDDRVLDMLVALSYPEVFAIKPSPTMMGELAIGGGGGGNVFLEASPFLVGGSIFDACNPYYYGLSLYGWDGCSPYGFYGYGYGFPPYGYYGGGWYEAGGGGGIIVGPIVPPSSQGHGQVVNGKGYVSGDSGGSSASSGGGSSSGSSSSGSSGGGFSGSSGGDRTAVPR